MGLERKVILNGVVRYVTPDGKVFNDKMVELKLQTYPSGYKYVACKKKHFLVHRIVAMAFIVGYSEDKEVHHINENKSDNRVENLVVMTEAEHQHLHKQKYPLTKKCVVCGKEFTPHKTKRKRQQTCSHECWLELAKIRAAKRKRPINQYTVDGVFVKKWDSCRDIQNASGFSEANISKCCNGKIHSYKGYAWKYA